jgi:plasmid replication initiation protein
MDTKRKRAKGSLTIQQDPEMVLKKHVGLIHCENKLTLIQRKICNILLFNALDKINDQEVHEISLRQLCSLIGYNSNDSKLIKDSIKSLISVVMEWNLLEDSKFINESDYPEEVISWNASSLLAGASIKSGVIRYSYSPQIKTVLSSLDIYGRINLFVQSRFDSTYSLVLYENCVRFKNINQTAWFSIELFRSLMGVSANKYASFKEFKRNVINVAIKEVNQKSDIYIEPQFKKIGKTISAVQFLISENEKYKPAFRKLHTDKKESASHKLSALIEVLVSEYQLSEKQAREISSKYEYEYIIQKINLVKTKKNIDHPGAYLISALKEDYREGAAKVRKRANEAENSYLREEKKAHEILSLKNKYMSYKFREYTRFIQQKAENIQRDLKEKFEAFLIPNAEIFRLYKKSGLLSPFVMANYIGFIDKHFSHLIGDYMSFDDYISSENIDEAVI